MFWFSSYLVFSFVSVIFILLCSFFFSFFFFVQISSVLFLQLINNAILSFTCPLSITSQQKKKVLHRFFVAIFTCKNANLVVYMFRRSLCWNSVEFYICGEICNDKKNGIELLRTSMHFVKEYSASESGLRIGALGQTDMLNWKKKI